MRLGRVLQPLAIDIERQVEPGHVERHQPEKISVLAVTARRARAAVTGTVEIGGGLADGPDLGIRREAFGERRLIRGDIVNAPMVPGARGGIRILANKGKAFSARRLTRPSQRRGQIVAFAGLPLGNRLPF